MKSVYLKFAEYIINTRYIRIYTSIIYILLTVFFTKGVEYLIADIKTILFVLIFLFLFTYSGIYMLNSYRDFEKDKVEKFSNTTSWNKDTYLNLGIFHLLVGVIFTQIFIPEYQIFNIIFIILNLLYTFYFKRVNKIVGIFVISPTHALRILIGLLIAKVNVIDYSVFLVAFYFLTVYSHILKAQAKNSLHAINIYLLQFVLFIVITTLSVFTYSRIGVLAGIFIISSAIITTLALRNERFSTKLAKSNL